ncbi:hypothetical protein [uncultured Helicobacter sp.]|uniref:hypothetical protein n=1 Tax=uncultured Helicobacter sp. TaxID=175537 RepID=UPI003752B221
MSQENAFSFEQDGYDEHSQHSPLSASAHTCQSPQEREALAQGLQEENVVGARHLLYGLGLFVVIVGLCFPKIYLTNTIYATSKEVLSLQTSREILYEENKKLRRELEDIDFRFRVLDNLEQEQNF